MEFFRHKNMFQDLLINHESMDNNKTTNKSS